MSLFLASASAANGLPVPFYAIVPFALLLAMIALMPFISRHWWEHHYPHVSLTLGALVTAYYWFARHDITSVSHALHEYASFIALIGSLFVVAGGIRIDMKGESTPLRNCIFLGAGAVLANFIGTTGASMLLIRPWIKSNKYRITTFHVVFFIFIVSNCGGCLTPIGDPPLFLGFLRGVPFLWVLEKCWAAWLVANGLLIAVFYVLDRRNFLRAPAPVREKETGHEVWSFSGLHNLALLALIIAAVFLPSPWRETAMLACAAASWFTTKREIHEFNDFSWEPIKEVALLFIGIFLTMIPALAFLADAARAGVIPLDSPMQYYWATGTLSAFLDNAPTYLAFLSTSFGHYGLSVDNPAHMAKYIAEHDHHLIGVALGAVFFGAASYIGNGPNFMVKSIAERADVHMPSFLGYIGRFTLPFLLPILAIISLLFFSPWAVF
jgi:Na+/H+ antiporter NhaD/arsenite permease-like protein